MGANKKQNPISHKKKPGASRASNQKAKTKATRKRIMDAAREVFTNYPYDAASIRMIGAEGGFNHSFIRYHFRTKARLFEAVSRELINQYFQASTEIVLDLETRSLIEGLGLTVDRFVDFGFENPEALYVMMLNMGAVDNVKDAFPGMRYLRRFHVDTLSLFTQSNYFAAPDREVNMVIFCSSIIVANCVGASRFYSKILNMDTDHEQYRQWVKDTLIFLFYPSLKKLVFADNKKSRKFLQNSARHDLKEKSRGKAARNKIIKAAKNVLAMGPYSPALKKLLADIEKSAIKIAKKKKPGQGRQKQTKGEATREKIILVARKVFTRYPYNAASIRMIGEQGGFDFTLLYHYFPKKAELFEAVISELFKEYLVATTSIIQELEADSLRENVSLFINRTLDYCFENPEVMMGSMQNVAQIDKFEDLPGFEYLSRFLVESLGMFRKFMPLPKGDEQVRMWLYGFGTVVFNCVGASSYHAQVLGMDPNDKKYRQWVKDSLMYIFYPSLKQLIFKNP